MASMAVDENCVTEFNQMKLRKTKKWIIYKIEDEKIVVDNAGSGALSDFKAALPKGDCRYAVYDSTSTGKIQFILWSPDSSPVKSRMTYASFKDSIMKRLDGVAGAALGMHEDADLDAL